MTQVQSAPPDFLDHFVFTFQEAADLLGITEADIATYLGLGNGESLVLDRPNNSRDEHVTWAEFVTIALFLPCARSGVSELGFTTQSGHEAHFAASRNRVKEAARRLPNVDPSSHLRRELQRWVSLFDADDDGWAVACFPQGRHGPKIHCDGTIELPDED